MKTLYLAGPMRGIPLYNFPEFDRVAEKLRSVGYAVISPADLDRQCGFDPALGHVADSGFLKDAIWRDLSAIVSKADGVALLDGWKNSVGATTEKSVAEWAGIPVKHWDVWHTRALTDLLFGTPGPSGGAAPEDMCPERKPLEPGSIPSCSAKPQEPRFERMARPTLQSCISVFEERGGQYGDTWEECQWVKLKSAARLLGIGSLTQDQCRILAVSSMCDIKYAREMGGYKEDSPKDGINYEALRIGEIAEYQKNQKKHELEHTLNATD